MTKSLADAWEEGYWRGWQRVEREDQVNPYTNNAIEQAERRVIEAAKALEDWKTKSNRLVVGWRVDETPAEVERGYLESKLEIEDAVRALRDLESEAK